MAQTKEEEREQVQAERLAKWFRANMDEIMTSSIHYDQQSEDIHGFDHAVTELMDLMAKGHPVYINDINQGIYSQREVWYYVKGQGRVKSDIYEDIANEVFGNPHAYSDLFNTEADVLRWRLSELEPKEDEKK